jgi:hypothetical protein
VTEVEAWRPIEGYPDYEVSSLGRVRSLKWGKVRILKASRGAQDYRAVDLYANRVRVTLLVHRLVARAFLGPRPDGLETRHLSGDKADNSVANLRYGTHSENMQDRVLHGNDPDAAKTECVNKHPFSVENTYVYRGSRQCRACNRERSRATRIRQQLAAANVQLITGENAA